MFKYSSKSKTIALLPGSRTSEIKNNLPIMLKSTKHAAFNDYQFIIIEANLCHRSLLENLSSEYPQVKIITKDQLNNINISYAVASSGTVCLELALCLIPTIAIYKLSWLTYQIALRVINTKWITLPNLIANQNLISELIKRQPTLENLQPLMIEMLSNKYQEKCIQGLSIVEKKLNRHDGSIANILRKWVSDTNLSEIS